MNLKLLLLLSLVSGDKCFDQVVKGPPTGKRRKETIVAEDYDFIQLIFLCKSCVLD